jgi:hypothetical protein
MVLLAKVTNPLPPLNSEEHESMVIPVPTEMPVPPLARTRRALSRPVLVTPPAVRLMPALPQERTAPLMMATFTKPVELRMPASEPGTPMSANRSDPA